MTIPRPKNKRAQAGFCFGGCGSNVTALHGAGLQANQKKNV